VHVWFGNALYRGCIQSYDSLLWEFQLLPWNAGPRVACLCVMLSTTSLPKYLWKIDLGCSISFECVFEPPNKIKHCTKHWWLLLSAPLMVTTEHTIDGYFWAHQFSSLRAMVTSERTSSHHCGRWLLLSAPVLIIAGVFCQSHIWCQAIGLFVYNVLHQLIKPTKMQFEQTDSRKHWFEHTHHLLMFLQVRWVWVVLAIFGILLLHQ